jgi:hypothetical protein
MVAEVVDAIIGVDTHRDSHEVEIADPRGTPIATTRISNDSGGFTQLLSAIAELGPGPRVAVSLEGSRSYGIGLARALTAAGLLIIECEQPVRRQRRGKGKSDPIDAHLAVLAALRLDADRLPELLVIGQVGMPGGPRISIPYFPATVVMTSGSCDCWTARGGSDNLPAWVDTSRTN